MVGLEVQDEAAGDPNPGAWAYDEVDVFVQRQAGKTTLLRPVMVHRCGVPRARVFMTAQTGRKARARWMDATDDILTSVYRDRVRRKVSHSFEELRWTSTAATVVPFAPNEDDMHGETPDLVSVDEVWAYDAEQARKLTAAYEPGFATKNGQTWKTSTAGTPKSTWYQTTRRAGRRAVEQGVRLGVAYFEWSLPDMVGGVPLDDLPDVELVQAAIDHHPAVCHTPGCVRGAAPACPHGFIVRAEAIWSAWRKLQDTADDPRSEFLRAYGNREQGDRSSSWRAIDAGEFLRAATLEQIPADAPVALGVEVDPDLRDAAVYAAWREPDGRRRLRTELIRHDQGAAWVARFVYDVVGRQDVTAVGMLGTGPARDVADALAALLDDDKLLRISAVDHAAACARVLRELREKTWTHRGEPELAEAAEHAGTRRVGTNGRAWASQSEHTTTVLSAWTLAGWAYDHAPETEPDRPPFWMG